MNWIFERAYEWLATRKARETEKPSIQGWHEEHDFWVKKAERAFIRFQIAVKNGDEPARQIARKQFDLYYKRSKDCVPDSVKEQWKENEDRNRQEALGEIL